MKTNKDILNEVKGNIFSLGVKHLVKGFIARPVAIVIALSLALTPASPLYAVEPRPGDGIRPMPEKDIPPAQSLSKAELNRLKSLKLVTFDREETRGNIVKAHFKHGAGQPGDQVRITHISVPDCSFNKPPKPACLVSALKQTLTINFSDLPTGQPPMHRVIDLEKSKPNDTFTLHVKDTFELQMKKPNRSITGVEEILGKGVPPKPEPKPGTKEHEFGCQGTCDGRGRMGGFQKAVREFIEKYPPGFLPRSGVKEIRGWVQLPAPGKTAELDVKVVYHNKSTIPVKVGVKGIGPGKWAITEIKPPPAVPGRRPTDVNYPQPGQKPPAEGRKPGPAGKVPYGYSYVPSMGAVPSDAVKKFFTLNTDAYKELKGKLLTGVDSKGVVLPAETGTVTVTLQFGNGKETRQASVKITHLKPPPGVNELLARYRIDDITLL